MKKYNIGDIIDVKIKAIEQYGAFVYVDDSYSGLIHISQINGKYIKNIDRIFKINDVKTVKVIGINEDKKQLKLTMIGVKQHNKVNSNKDLSETKLGFELFEEILPNWIEEKMEEINNKN